MLLTFKCISLTDTWAFGIWSLIEMSVVFPSNMVKQSKCMYMKINLTFGNFEGLFCHFLNTGACLENEVDHALLQMLNF